MNTINLLRNDMERHRVNVTLPGETKPKHLYLLMIKAETNTFEDLMVTFDKKATPLHLRLARRCWGGNAKKTNIYGVFLDNDLKMVFAFNRLFADFKKGQVVYYDLDEIIEKAIDNKQLPIDSDLEMPPRPLCDPSDTWPTGGGDMLVRYSIADPHSNGKN